MSAQIGEPTEVTAAHAWWGCGSRAGSLGAMTRESSPGHFFSHRPEYSYQASTPLPLPPVESLTSGLVDPDWDMGTFLGHSTVGPGLGLEDRCSGPLGKPWGSSHWPT